jgi:predicted membrane channel-forming protein YqfA (hemolysin III family)
MMGGRLEEQWRTRKGRVAVEWTFGSFLWGTLVFFFWFTFIWMFIAAFADIFRRDDLTGWAKAWWIILIVILPFLGILIYVIARPKVVGGEYGRMAGEPRHRGGAAGTSAADQIATAAKLHDEGKITADEFEQLKQQALSR